MELDTKFSENIEYITVPATRLAVNAIARMIKFLEQDDQDDLMHFALALGV